MAIDAIEYLRMDDLEDAVEEGKSEIEDLESEILDLEQEKSNLYLEDEVDYEREEEIDLEIASKQDEAEELRAENEEMNDFYSEMEGYVSRGETLIREDVFEDYARELAYDIGAVDRNADWPTNRIDWEAAADDLKIDYTEGTYDGWTYYGRG